MPSTRPDDAANGYAAVIGDVILSSADPGSRAALQTRLVAAMRTVNAGFDPAQPFQQTVGDEVQALFADLGDALLATLELRLAVAATADMRFGVGWGRLLTVDPTTTPFGQDGPAWWAARTAVDEVRSAARRPEMPRGCRTLFRLARGLDRRTIARAARRAPRDRFRRPWTQLQLPGFARELPEPGTLSADVEGTVNAYLVCRDEIVSSMSPRDVRLLRALLAGERQADAAAREGITQSAVSQRNLRSGAYAILAAHAHLGSFVR